MDPIAVGTRAPGSARRRRVEAARSTRVVGNGRYTVIVRGDGTGVSFTEALALGPWPVDPLLDSTGVWIFVRDTASGRFAAVGPAAAAAAAAPAPVPGLATALDRDWSPGVARLGGVLLDDIEFTLELCVPSNGTFEVRRLTLTHRGGGARRLEITTYAEVVLATPAAHAAHPGFSKLFVQTAFDAESGTLLAHRRPRAADEETPWLFHAFVGAPAAQYETDRVRFIGRGSTLVAAQALGGRAPLTSTVGNVLDPIVSLRRVVDVAPDAPMPVSFVLGVGADRGAALDAARELASDAAVDTVVTAARAAAASAITAAELPPQAAAQFEALAGAMLDGHPALRASATVLERAAGDRDAIAALAPGRRLALLHAEAAPGAVAEFVQAARYWRELGLPIEARALVDAAVVPGAAEAGVTVVRAETMEHDEIDTLDAWAHLVVDGPLPDVTTAVPAAIEIAACEPEAGTRSAGHRSGDLAAFNGTGGFAADGREYVVQFRCGDAGLEGLPPQPWTNVIANEQFGFLVSETGAATTWSRNSREHRLTPWSNDALLDPHGEALYVRDEADGRFWSPLGGPAPAPGTEFEARHGLGCSTFRSTSHGIETEIEMFVPPHEPLRVTRVQLTNRTQRPRRLSLFSYLHWVLGASADTNGRFVHTTIEPDGRTLWARNRFAAEFADGVAFATVQAPQALAVHVTADRRAFLGEPASMARPAALVRQSPLPPRAGAGLDACAAHQVELELAPEAGAEIVFVLGETAGVDAARALVERWRAARAAGVAAEARAFWEESLAGLQIRTPSPALDRMTNTWLPYQTLSCRIWARSAFYQSGGAFGFRDQLQDAIALAPVWPHIARAQILLHAAHQFPEGDVLHWWHPPGARGIRTRFADDLLWLPYLAASYVQATGDKSILDEPVPFVHARRLEPDEDEAFVAATPMREHADLYTHCTRALDRSLAVGAHGLPLFGSGDWNDGMNRVGRQGRGESVWMGFFLWSVLDAFTPFCEARADTTRLRRFAAYREGLRHALETAGWDGEWYRRGYYDDGTPLGSRASDECRIDALVQAWAVLSGAARPERARAALDAVLTHLVSEPEGLIRLLSPPFVDTPHDPGYIKGYVAGVRENGGQYTHAALWVVRALAQLGRNDRVASLLEMLTPLHHTRTPADVARYRVEPYVVAADVYGAPPHVGRGGWTWYTGSAGWMYRVVVESLLGFGVEHGRTIVLSPCVPDEWDGFGLRWRVPGTTTSYTIEARNPRRRGVGVASATLDGDPVPVEHGAARVPLARDGAAHRVEITLGGAA